MEVGMHLVGVYYMLGLLSGCLPLCQQTYQTPATLVQQLRERVGHLLLYKLYKHSQHFIPPVWEVHHYVLQGLEC